MKWNCFLRRVRKLYERPSPVKLFSKIHQIFYKTGKTKEVHIAGWSLDGHAEEKGLREAPLFPGIFLFLKGHFLQDTLSGAEPAQKPRFSPAALLYFLKELFPGIRIETAQDSGSG